MESQGQLSGALQLLTGTATAGRPRRPYSGGTRDTQRQQYETYRREAGEEGSIKRRKIYTYTCDVLTGKRVLTHRWVAEQALGRPLLPREVVHHRDGNSLNNDPLNLIVLPSQRVHAHAEFHGRRAQSGMPSLFPELFQVIPSGTQGTLFEHVLVWQGEEPPLPPKRSPLPPVLADMPRLFPSGLETFQSPAESPLGLTDSAAERSGSLTLGEVLDRVLVQVTSEEVRHQWSLRTLGSPSQGAQALNE